MTASWVVSTSRMEWMPPCRCRVTVPLLVVSMRHVFENHSFLLIPNWDNFWRLSICSVHIFNSPPTPATTIRAKTIPRLLLRTLPENRLSVMPMSPLLLAKPNLKTLLTKSLVQFQLVEQLLCLVLFGVVSSSQSAELYYCCDQSSLRSLWNYVVDWARETHLNGTYDDPYCEWSLSCLHRIQWTFQLKPPLLLFISAWCHVHLRPHLKTDIAPHVGMVRERQWDLNS